jgi:diphthamide synthase (EF-2-diphthine--ammonia ligase)
MPEQGVRHVVFGDLFLADLRAWREERLRSVGMEGYFPLWGENTGDLARRMIADGVRAHIVCLDPSKLAPVLAGRLFDQSFLRDLDSAIDPCGENGEFHTLVSDGPFFDRPLDLIQGQRVEREDFVFNDFCLNSKHVLGDKHVPIG